MSTKEVTKAHRAHGDVGARFDSHPARPDIIFIKGAIASAVTAEQIPAFMDDDQFTAHITGASSSVFCAARVLRNQSVALSKGEDGTDQVVLLMLI